MAPKDAKDDKPVKINKWDGSAVKNAVDDAIKEVLTEKFKYVENFGLMDGRLFMCSIAVGVAMYALLWDFLYPFPQSKAIRKGRTQPLTYATQITSLMLFGLHTAVLIFCVGTYFIMMGLLTLYSTYREKGIFMIASQKTAGKKDNVWEASSFLKKYDDKYHLVLSVQDGKSGSRREASVKKSVASFVDVNGSVVQELVDNEVTKLHNSLLTEKKEK